MTPCGPEGFFKLSKNQYMTLPLFIVVVNSRRTIGEMFHLAVILAIPNLSVKGSVRYSWRNIEPGGDMEYGYGLAQIIDDPAVL